MVLNRGLWTPSDNFRVCRWSNEDKDCLCWYFSQSLGVADPIGHIGLMYTERSGQTKNRLEASQLLLSIILASFCFV